MSGLGDKIKVERLDTGRLARIEANVLARRQLPGEGMRERRDWLRMAPLAAAACGLVLVAGALGYWLRGPGGGGGAVAGGAPVPAVTTGPGESATVAIGDAIVTVAGSSQVSFRARPDGRIDLDLARGKVDCDVTPRPGRPVFAVHAADVDVDVVGTAFSVARDGDEVTVEVTRGKVSVTRGGKQVFLAAGENWPAGTRVAEVETEVAAPGSGSGSGSGSEAGSGSGSGSGRTQKTGHRVPDTGHRTQDTGKTAGKAAVSLPDGLPALAECSDCLAIAMGDDRTYDDATQSRALYTHIHRKLSAGDRADALRYADVYLRRFPKGAETAAVKQLKRIAGGD